ncbi:coproporphyrinogen III oxidase [Aliidongia dinghuensis]|uniref:Heme chaperone HemW n=1 Tax=Aliidongia dinghuensis TaxID=1867774 RepID=A0A8J2YWP9_9PROT|nr:radical SAM family heme chaperone HemW [Aliidongia dinghuensis]GGF33028.1 coproporphyrinogen III oxidase [Aliidongia dinghuensis]
MIQVPASRGPETPGFAVYVHWPFCLAKCPYCDFNSHVRERIEQDRWRAALLRELDHYAAQTPGRAVTSIFFGGGTPSLMEPATVGAVIERIGRNWSLDADVEITLEANPTSVEAHKFQGFRAAGVNRVSLGIQALDPAALKFLGRQHTAGEALEAIALAARHFDRYSFDLIYARPGQTVDSWTAELDRALGFAAGHLSVYQLTIEPGTAFATAYARGDFALPDDELAGELYELTQARLAAAGLPAYEISNHARAGEASRHNLTYWRYGDYVGVGPGAHGRLTLGGTKTATRQAKAPETWLGLVEANGHGTQETEIVDRDARAEEMVMMGLRLAEGIPRRRFRDELALEPEDLLDPVALGQLTEGGFVTLDRDRLVATAAGRQRLNAVLAALLR